MTKQEIKDFMMEEFEDLWYNYGKEIMESEVKDGFGFRIEVFNNGNIIQFKTYKNMKEFDCGLVKNLDDIERRIDEMLA